MKLIFCIPLAVAFLIGTLPGCSRPAVPFIEVNQRYTFYFENDRNWVKGKVLERTHDGWVLIKYEGTTRWINANQTLMIQPTD